MKFNLALFYSSLGSGRKEWKRVCLPNARSLHIVLTVGAPGRPIRLSPRAGPWQVLAGGPGVGLLKLSARASVSPSLKWTTALTPQGQGLAVLSRVSAELHVHHRCHLLCPSQGCSLVPARARVRLRSPHCSEGRRHCPQGVPAPIQLPAQWNR